jgi:bacteriocin-like protein
MEKKEKREETKETAKELTLEQLQAVSGGRGGVNWPRKRGGTAN